jgi:hypothetical protein
VRMPSPRPVASIIKAKKLSRGVGPHAGAVRGPFVGWLQAVVPSREAGGSGKPLNEKRSSIPPNMCPAGLAGEGNYPELSLWALPVPKRNRIYPDAWCDMCALRAEENEVK